MSTVRGKVLRGTGTEACGYIGRRRRRTQSGFSPPGWVPRNEGKDKATHRELAISVMPSNDQKRLVAPAPMARLMGGSHYFFLAMLTSDSPMDSIRLRTSVSISLKLCREISVLSFTALVVCSAVAASDFN
jgi:hypothetical protein